MDLPFVSDKVVGIGRVESLKCFALCHCIRNQITNPVSGSVLSVEGEEPSESRRRQLALVGACLLVPLENGISGTLRLLIEREPNWIELPLDPERARNHCAA